VTRRQARGHGAECRVWFSADSLSETWCSARQVIGEQCLSSNERFSVGRSEEFYGKYDRTVLVVKVQRLCQGHAVVEAHLIRGNDADAFQHAAQGTVLPEIDRVRHPLQGDAMIGRLDPGSK